MQIQEASQGYAETTHTFRGPQSQEKKPKWQKCTILGGHQAYAQR